MLQPNCEGLHPADSAAPSSLRCRSLSDQAKLAATSFGQSPSALQSELAAFSQPSTEISAVASDGVATLRKDDRTTRPIRAAVAGNWGAVSTFPASRSLRMARSPGKAVSFLLCLKRFAPARF
jgi:hypothetical protein